MGLELLGNVQRRTCTEEVQGFSHALTATTACPFISFHLKFPSLVLAIYLLKWLTTNCGAYATDFNLMKGMHFPQGRLNRQDGQNFIPWFTEVH